jgi:hypothetical protein
MKESIFVVSVVLPFQRHLVYRIVYVVVRNAELGADLDVPLAQPLGIGMNILVLD